METLVQTAVLEISRLVDVECEVLLSELTRRNTPSSSEDTGARARTLVTHSHSHIAPHVSRGTYAFVLVLMIRDIAYSSKGTCMQSYRSKVWTQVSYSLYLFDQKYSKEIVIIL